jgi:hypothetical protein
LNKEIDRERERERERAVIPVLCNSHGVNTTLIECVIHNASAQLNTQHHGFHDVEYVEKVWRNP